MDYTMLGRRIAERRKELQMRQNQLAAAAGLSKSYMANLEAGASKPSLATLVAIAQALQTGCDWLLRDTLLIGPGSPYWLADDKGNLPDRMIVMNEPAERPAYEPE